MSAATELAMMEWQEGLDRLEHLHAGRKREAVYRRVVDEIVSELTRRVGQTFTLADLTRVYADSAGWCRQVAQNTTEEVWAHDLTIVADAAFARFARNASDYRDWARG